jgi:hypothetical protein
LTSQANEQRFPSGVEPLFDLAPPDYVDPVIEAFKRDVDRTLLRENLKLTVQQRFEKLESFVEFARELRDAGKRARREIRKS